MSRIDSYYIHANKFFLLNDVLDGGYLFIENGHFVGYQDYEPDGLVLDYCDRFIAPGLVDTHIHGIRGFDVMDCSFEAMKMIVSSLPECGVTSFLPTTLTASVDDLNNVSEFIGENWSRFRGAKIQGIFFEGPFFTERYKGAQNPLYFIDPSLEIFYRWQDLAKGLIKKIAIAPEREGSMEFIRELSRRGVVVSIAHTDATFDQSRDAVNAGASIFVHTYNAMRGLNHREPGVVGAALSMKNCFNELICDGHHVHPKAIQILIDSKGTDRIVLISDCMRAGCMPDGKYTLGEFEVEVKEGAARMRNGSLAGSILKLNQAVSNLVEWDLTTLAEAIKMASYVPAKSVNIEDRCGSISPGMDADFIVLNKDLELLETYIDGDLFFRKG